MISSPSLPRTWSAIDSPNWPHRYPPAPIPQILGEGGVHVRAVGDERAHPGECRKEPVEEVELVLVQVIRSYLSSKPSLPAFGEPYLAS
jgi:hypothetical protein